MRPQITWKRDTCPHDHATANFARFSSTRYTLAPISFSSVNFRVPFSSFSSLVPSPFFAPADGRAALAVARRARAPGNRGVHSLICFNSCSLATPTL